MNIAFYVDTFSNTDLNTSIVECLNEAVDKNLAKDCSLFYNNMAQTNYQTKFGFFNATEIWNYHGVLISDCAQNTMFADKIVNKFVLKHLYKPEGLFSLIEIANRYEVLVLNEGDRREVYRQTGKNPKLLRSLKISDLLEAL